MSRSIALLRGINVGGNKKVPMADLKKALEKSGYKNVKTLLASGNVLLDAAKKGEALRKDLETLLEKTFKFTVPVIVRDTNQIEALAKADPFKGIPVTEATRLYVTFLGNGSKAKGTITIPYATEDGNFRILKKTDGEVLSVLTVTEDRGSVDAMSVIEKEFGKNVTTRNWNTVLKLIA